MSRIAPQCVFLAGLWAALAITTSAPAQDAPAATGRTDQHKWLQKFVGHWDVESKGSMGEGQPAMVSKGTIESESLGGFWVMNRMTADFGGMGFTGVQTVGYDPAKKKYVGTWVDSTGSFMWKYEGFVDDSGKKLILEATGPDMMNPEKTRLYRDSYEFVTNDEVITTSSMQKDDGSWSTFMTGRGKRVPAKK